MDNILRCSGYLPTMTLVHNIFIENYMLSANGSYVKVYLYLAKCIQAGEKDLSISTLADKMDNTEKDVLRALHYWEKHNLIHLSKDESGITGIEMLNPEVPVTVHTGKVQKKTDTSGQVHTEKGREDKAAARTDSAESACTEENTYTETAGQKAIEQKTTDENKKAANGTKIKTPPNQMGQLSNDEEFVWTCRVIESYVNRPLNPQEVQLISYLYDSLSFSPDLLLYLYEYCISRGKTHVNYIKSIALSWHKEDIKNPEEAKSFSVNYNSSYIAISKALGLGYPLATTEKEYINRWLNEWHMDLAVVLNACNRSVLQTQKGNLSYTETILDNWHKNNICTLQDIEKADEAYAQSKAAARTKKNPKGTQDNNTWSRNQFHQFHQREVSQEELDELERKLLAR